MRGVAYLTPIEREASRKRQLETRRRYRERLKKRLWAAGVRPKPRGLRAYIVDVWSFDTAHWLGKVAVRAASPRSAAARAVESFGGPRTGEEEVEVLRPKAGRISGDYKVPNSARGFKATVRVGPKLS